MRKVALIILMTGMVMNVYGAEEGESFDGSRVPLSSLTTQHNRSPYKGPYPECSQHIQYEKDEAAKKARQKGREEGRREGELKARRENALALLAMGLSDEQIIRATRLTAEKLAELKQK